MGGHPRVWRRPPQPPRWCARPLGAPRTSGAAALLALGRPGLLLIAALAPDDGQPLGEHFLEVSDRPALHQHVPVTARRLGLGGRRLIAGGRHRDRTADAALPLRWHLCLGRERHAESVALRAIESDLLTGCQVSVTVVLVARGAKASTT